MCRAADKWNMNNQLNWQQHINLLLTRNGQFELIDTSKKNKSTLEFYQQKLGDIETIIKVGYLDNGRLITLDITNPKTPGHNAEQIEYFYENDFEQSAKIRFVDVGLPFSAVNIEAINQILKSGLIGTETKYYAKGKFQFSKVSKPVGYNQELSSITHHFSDKNFWIRAIKNIVKPRSSYVIEEIDLKSVFGGVK